VNLEAVSVQESCSIITSTTCCSEDCQCGRL